MLLNHRELIAEGLIIVVAIAGIAATIVVSRRRHRQRLRRRGIKKYGH
jgi:hypothetical protein